MADSVYRPRNEIWPMNCSSSSLDNFGPEDYFLACKHCQKTEGPIYGSVGIEVVIPE